MFLNGERQNLFSQTISDVSATSLITLYSHAVESQSPNPILNDPKAVEITQQLNPELSKSSNTLYQNLANGKLDKKLVVHIACRAKRYDQYVTDFLHHSSNAIVVNIGCGLDTRFHRLDNGQITVYDLDFPAVIEIKKNFLEETDRYHFIPSSVLNFEWMEPLSRFKNRSFLFLAEGVFMYLHEAEVKSLVLELQSRFPGSELVCEMFNAFWLKKSFKWMMDIKLQRELHLGREAMFNFGIKDGKDLERWNSGIQFLDEWSYFDEPDEKLGVLRFFKHVELFRKTQWTVHYKLN